MRYLIGIDDTDNLESRGTGHRARQLGHRLGEAGAELLGVTRHQLFVSPEIPYTSHNSAACLEVRSTTATRETIVAFCRKFLLAESAPGSDAGLCVADADGVAADVVAFGTQAKRVVLPMSEAERRAGRSGIHLEGVTGTRIGVIGALAAVGLRTGGNDGRFLWLAGLREMSGDYEAGSLRRHLQLDAVETEAGAAVADGEWVSIGPWPRPLMRSGRKVFLVQENEGGDVRWSGLDKERLKRLSD